MQPTWESMDSTQSSSLADIDRKWELPDLPKPSKPAREWDEDIGKVDLENLWFLCGGETENQRDKSFSAPKTIMQVVREREYGDTGAFKARIQDILKQPPKQSEITVLVFKSDTLYDGVNLVDESSRREKLGLELKAPQVQSYHSHFSGPSENRMLDIRHCPSQANKRHKSEPSAGSTTRIQHKMERRPNLVFFNYSLTTDRTICILAERDAASSTMGRDRATIESLQGFARLAASHSSWLHPFSVQLIVMYHIISTRKEILSSILDKLIDIEHLLLDGSLIAMKSTIESFKEHIQKLHEISRRLITLEHSNGNDISTLDSLTNDVDRLGTEAGALPEKQKHILPPSSQQRIKDGILSLHNTCLDRSRRITNRKQRTQNLITLLYNLTANRDSVTTISIAQHNARIAKAARQDSVSMSVIATLTMIYLPPTLLCGLFGINFFGLDTDKDKPVFVVSSLWWIYPLSTLILTGGTVCVWLWWKKRCVKPVPECEDV